MSFFSFSEYTKVNVGWDFILRPTACQTYSTRQTTPACFKDSFTAAEDGRNQRTKGDRG